MGHWKLEYECEAFTEFLKDICWKNEKYEAFKYLLALVMLCMLSALAQPQSTICLPNNCDIWGY